MADPSVAPTTAATATHEPVKDQSDSAQSVEKTDSSGNDETPIATEPQSASIPVDKSKTTSSDETEPIPQNAPTTKEEVMEEPQGPKPGLLARAMAKLNLNVGILLIMFKGSLPPIIAISMYQATPVSNVYGALGYLIPIISITSMSILPRAKYIQNLALNLIAICVGAAIAMLGLWTAVQARAHTSPDGLRPGYNSSASAVCAIWLIANVWTANVLRAKYPQLQITVIMYSILTNISFTYGPSFYSMEIVKPFIKQLLEGFLTAFALATGVNLFIIPISCRDLVNREHSQFIAAVRGTLKAQTKYLTSLETSDMFEQDVSSTASVEDQPGQDGERLERGSEKPGQPVSPEAQALKNSLKVLRELHGKLHADTPFAKREIAYGKLCAADYSAIFSLLRGIMIPLIGISTIQDIFERLAIQRGWANDVSTANLETMEEMEKLEQRNEEKKVWNEVLKTLHIPFTTLSECMDDAMQHAGLILEMIPRPKKQAETDVEQEGDAIKPGDKRFLEHLEARINEFYCRRGEVLKCWAKQKGLSKDKFDCAPLSSPDHPPTAEELKHRQDQQQLYIILYMEFLLHSVATAILELCRFADKKVEDGTMAKKRFIFPTRSRLIKWAKSIGSDDAPANADNPHLAEGGSSTVYLGSSFGQFKKDPEHLPPKNKWEKLGNSIRAIPHFFNSEEAAFGVRVVCATMTVGIVGFLESTQTFFIQQRLVWAMIIIAIGMTMTSGQSLFGFAARVGGTALSMVCAFIIWYIVDSKTPGVIVMLWLFIFVQMYFFINFPRFIAAWIIVIITEVLIVGYELQVRKIGIAAAEANGQPYYPIYELGPIRLATIAGGTLVAFIWVFLPYPLTDRSWLRKDLGATLYMMANYYSVVHSTINGRLHHTLGDPASRSSPGSQLEHIRHKIFSKLMLLMPSLQAHAEFQKWEISIGGKFPRKTYEEIIMHVSNLSNYITLMSFCSQTWGAEDADSQWTRDFLALVDTVSPTSHQITSVLALLSASVRNGNALPPYMLLPQPFHLSQRLEQLDRGILDSRHVEEPAYSAYAVMQVASSLIIDDIQKLVENVKELVGEVDFSFQVADSPQASVSSLEKEGIKGKQD